MASRAWELPFALASETRAHWRMGAKRNSTGALAWDAPVFEAPAERYRSMYSTAFLDLPPLQAAAGEVHLPGSKSISNRVLLLAALSNGTTTVHDLLASDDTRVMLDALRQIGCTVDEAGSTGRITGLGGRLPQSPAKLFLGNAGTAMRPLTAAL
eukprot:gene2223-biopygen1633